MWPEVIAFLVLGAIAAVVMVSMIRNWHRRPSCPGCGSGNTVQREISAGHGPSGIIAEKVQSLVGCWDCKKIYARTYCSGEDVYTIQWKETRFKVSSINEIHQV